jgi:tRNA 2-thiouridine synthesizing protein A
MTEYVVAKTLDYKGLKCPMPVVKTSQQIGTVKVGEIIEVHTTDPGSLADFPAWAKTMGHQLMETRQEPGVIRIFLKRLK